MLAIEKSVPGFGGFYVDSLERIALMLQPDTIDRSSAARTRIAAVLAASDEPKVRAMSPLASTAIVVQASWTLSQLVALENTIMRSAVIGLVGAGVSIVRNLVEVGFRADADLTAGVTQLERMGVDSAALAAAVWGPNVLSGSWTDRYRPTRGGIRMRLGRRGQWRPGVRSPDRRRTVLCVGDRVRRIRNPELCRAVQREPCMQVLLHSVE